MKVSDDDVVTAEEIDADEIDQQFVNPLSVDRDDVGDPLVVLEPSNKRYPDVKIQLLSVSSYPPFHLNTCIWVNKRLYAFVFCFQADQLKDSVTVQCGNHEGKLQLNKFFCPGLRSECILMNDGRWVTPKVFSIIGGKASLKNWKNAVRINNVSLR